MLRCVIVALLAGLTALPALAQVRRNFNPNVLRGELSFVQPPNVELNGKPARLAPGARIRGENNLLQLPTTLSGKRYAVFYTIEPGGLLMDVWILTAEERARKPWPTTPKEAQTWLFDTNAQVWSKP